MSLIAVMIAIAVLSAISVFMMGLFGGLSSSVLRENLEARQESVMRYVRVLLSQPDICSYALRSGAFNAAGLPPNVRFNFADNANVAEADITHLQVRRNGVGAATLGLTTGQLSAALRLDRISIRTPRTNLGEAPAQTGSITRLYQSPSQGAPVVQVLDTITAKLVVRFVATGQTVLGSPVRELSTDVTVAVDRVAADRFIAYCTSPQTVKSINLFCNDNTQLYPGQTACPVAGGSCYPVYYIVGFDPLGMPMCYCKTNCVN